ncbi:unnamed protein product, partial [Polarella glacialis]
MTTPCESENGELPIGAQVSRFLHVHTSNLTSAMPWDVDTGLVQTDEFSGEESCPVISLSPVSSRDPDSPKRMENTTEETTASMTMEVVKTRGSGIRRSTDDIYLDPGWSWLRRGLAGLIFTGKFYSLIGIMVMLNMILVVIETDLRAAGTDENEEQLSVVWA